MQSTETLLNNHDKDMKEYLNKIFKTRKKGQRRSDLGKERAAYKNILPTKYRSYVARANKMGIPFDLTIEEFNQLLSAPCVYCGSTASICIDQIECSEGYSKDNVQPCCYLCNQMKYNNPVEVFLKQVKRIYNHSIKNRL
jgi:hypothetical protein